MHLPFEQQITGDDFEKQKKIKIKENKNKHRCETGKPFSAHLRFHHFPVHRKNVTDYQKQLAVKDYLVSRLRRAKAFKGS